MKIAFNLACGVGAYCLLGVGHNLGLAAEPTKNATPVHVAGCPAKGVESGCLVLSSQGKTYDITAAPAQVDPANPTSPPAPPRIGYLGIILDGSIDAGSVGTCMQGPIIKDIKWSYSRERCETNSKTK